MSLDRPDWKTKEGEEWLHWDMNPFTGAVTGDDWATDVEKNREYRLRVQGFIALTDCPADTGGFFCVPGAHKIIRKWAKHHRDDAVGVPCTKNRAVGCHSRLVTCVAVCAGVFARVNRSECRAECVRAIDRVSE